MGTPQSTVATCNPHWLGLSLWRSKVVAGLEEVVVIVEEVGEVVEERWRVE
jgi:hypothetical protein